MAVAAGLIWIVAEVGSATVAPTLLAVVLVPVAVVATASGLRAAAVPAPRRRKPSGLARGGPVVAGAAVAVLAPLAALVAPAAGIAVMVVGGSLAAVVAAAPALSSARPVAGAARAAVAAVAPAVAVTSLILARHQGASLVAALLAAVAVYDAGAFIMGNGRSALGGPVGVISGMAAVGVVALFVAAVMEPPFSGQRPWVVFVAVAVLAPAGVRIASVVAGEARLPAWRRLDSLFLTGPVWVALVSFYLHR